MAIAIERGDHAFDQEALPHTLRKL
jgi:hypothetical protein